MACHVRRARHCAHLHHAAQRWRGPADQSDKISHIDMGYDYIDTVIIQDDHIHIIDTHIDRPYPKSISHIPYRYSQGYLSDVRFPISISHIDVGSYLAYLLTYPTVPGVRHHHQHRVRPRDTLQVPREVEPARHLPGRPVQLDPIEPTLKAPESKRLKLQFDTMLSTSAFKFNLRRYNLVSSTLGAVAFAGSLVGWCRLTPG